MSLLSIQSFKLRREGVMRVLFARFSTASLLAVFLAGCMGGGGDLNISPTSAGGSTTSNTPANTSSSSTSSGTQTGTGSNTNTPGSSGGASGSPASGSGTIATPGGRAGLAAYTTGLWSMVSPSSSVRYKFDYPPTNRVNAEVVTTGRGARDRDFIIRIDGVQQRFSNCPENSLCMSNVSGTFHTARYKKYTYGIIGTWNRVQTGKVRSDVFIVGDKSTSIPTRLRATYTGKALYTIYDRNAPYQTSGGTVSSHMVSEYNGRVRLNADFSRGRISGVLGQFRLSSSNSNRVNRTLLNLTGNIRGNTISYNISGRVEYNGSLRNAKAVGRGYFYGPNAREVGGAFVITDNNNNAYADAAFYGRR